MKFSVAKFSSICTTSGKFSKKWNKQTKIKRSRRKTKTLTRFFSESGVNGVNGSSSFISKVRMEQKKLNIKPVHHIRDTTLETATFGMGCFWAGESIFGCTPGVLRTTVGYINGYNEVPKDVNTQLIEIDYDTKIISYKKLLQIFWNNHKFGLTTSVTRNYQSLILYHNSWQKEIAELSKENEQENYPSDKIPTQIIFKRRFYPAKDYHQKYNLQKHSDLCETLDLSTQLLRTSYVATKLNGYLDGSGELQLFKNDINSLGLTPTQIEYCHENI